MGSNPDVVLPSRHYVGSGPTAGYAGSMAAQRKQSRSKTLGERELIANIRERAGQTQVAGRKGRVLHLGIGDDCAVLRPRAGEELGVTTDLSLENVHFRR